MFGRVRAVPRLCGFYPRICLTTEEKAWKNLSQGSRRVPASTIKIQQVKGKVQVKFIPEQAAKTHRRSTGIALLFL